MGNKLQKASQCFKSQEQKDFSNLMAIDVTNVQKRTFKDEMRLVKVINVYDGDTITIVTKLDTNENYRSYKFRLHGLDTPEIKPRKNIEDRDLHIAAAKAVKKALENRVLNRVVFVKFMEEEKFGRLMGYLHDVQEENCIPQMLSPAEQSINDWLIAEKLALPFTGATKKTEFTCDQLTAITQWKNQ